MNYSIILPVFRERENIGSLLSALNALSLPLAEVIVVDDHSDDGTEDVARNAARTLAIPVRVVQNPGRKGLSPSVIHGFSLAAGDILICMDADGQHRPEDLPDLLDQFSQHPDLSMVIGSRYVPGGGFTEPWSLSRRLCSAAAAAAARFWLQIRLCDPMSGFFAIRRAAYQRVSPFLRPAGFKIMLELAFLLSLTGRDRSLEHPILFAMRKHGKSKLSGDVILRYLLMLIRCFLLRSKIRRKLRQRTIGKEKAAA